MNAPKRTHWRIPCPFCRARVEVRRRWVDHPKLWVYGVQGGADVEFTCLAANGGCGVSGGPEDWPRVVDAQELELPALQGDSSEELLSKTYSRGRRERALARAAELLLRKSKAPRDTAAAIRAWAAQHLEPRLSPDRVTQIINQAALDLAQRLRARRGEA